MGNKKDAVEKTPKALPVGVSDFSDLIQGDYYYVDKSLFIKELLTNKTKVTLIPRPRRFGKTLNMSMLRYFFEKSEQSNRHLFDHLAVSRYPKIMTEQGQYPVIFMTLKDIKFDSWEKCFEQLKATIGAEFRRHSYLLASGVLDDGQKNEYRAIIDKVASENAYCNALHNLSVYLQQFYQKQTIILIDEYDAVIHAAYLGNFYKPAIDFMKPFLCGGLKDNIALKYAVLTGILRIAKESIFSGLNNLRVCTMLTGAYNSSFGFTEQEVDQMLCDYGYVDKKDSVRLWYNGYHCEKLSGLYNPWSMINFANEGGSIRSYWAHTANEDIIRQLVEPGSEEQQDDLNTLMSGGEIQKKIDENIVFEQLNTNPDVLWSLLLFSGYLTFTTLKQETTGLHVSLTIPNNEIKTVYFSSIHNWFKQKNSFRKYENIQQKPYHQQQQKHCPPQGALKAHLG